MDYLKDFCRLAFTSAASILFGVNTHDHGTRSMGLAITVLVLWLSFLLDPTDPRNHARAAKLLDRSSTDVFCNPSKMYAEAQAAKADPWADGRIDDQKDITLDDLIHDTGADAGQSGSNSPANWA